MAKGALDSTHTVVVKTENRGIRVVIGLLALIVWARWWWTGTLFAAVAYAVPPAVQEGQFGSITGALLPVAVDLLWFIGSVIITCGAWFWAAIWDVISGIFETFGYYSARRKAIDAAQKAATDVGTNIGATNAGAIASTEAVTAANTEAKQASGIVTAVAVSPPPNKLNAEKLKKLLDSHEDKLAAADLVFSKLNERLIAQSQRLGKLEQDASSRSDLSALAELVGKVNDRVEALESVRNLSASEPDKPATPKPAYRRATRQTPAKASTRKR